MTFLFTFRKAKSFTVDPTVFICVSMLARAVGPSIGADVKHLLDPMLAVGLRYVMASSTEILFHFLLTGIASLK